MKAKIFSLHAPSAISFFEERHIIAWYATALDELYREPGKAEIIHID